MQIIKPRERHEDLTYAHSFEWRATPGAGFSFDCDEHGTLFPPKNAAAAQNRENCFDGTYDVIDKGIVTYRNIYYTPAVGLCNSCKRQVELYDPMTNECECGALYNGGGQELAPRHQWEDQIDPEPGVVPGVDDLSGYV